MAQSYRFGSRMLADLSVLKAAVFAKAKKTCYFQLSLIYKP